MITVMLVDDHPVIRQGLRALLETETEIKVVGEATEGLEALRMAEELSPNVIVLDMMMKGISGIEVTRQLSKNSTNSAIVIFSMLGSEHHVLEALRAGARGYILKESPSDELIKAVREVAAGHRYLSSGILDRTIDGFLQIAETSEPDPLHTLTRREREVLYASAQGKTCAEIAKQLFVSRRTVESQRASLMRKLGLRNQHELVSYAIQKGIVAPESPQ
ncbi:MAG: response regulator transcription factor [Chloroflexota bacterium]